MFFLYYVRWTSEIYKDFITAKNLGIDEFVRYSDYLLCINLINDPFVKYHFYIVLIQYIKELIS